MTKRSFISKVFSSVSMVFTVAHVLSDPLLIHSMLLIFFGILLIWCQIISKFLVYELAFYPRWVLRFIFTGFALHEGEKQESHQYEDWDGKAYVAASFSLLEFCYILVLPDDVWRFWSFGNCHFFSKYLLRDIVMVVNTINFVEQIFLTTFITFTVIKSNEGINRNRKVINLLFNQLLDGVINFSYLAILTITKQYTTLSQQLNNPFILKSQWNTCNFNFLILIPINN